MASSRADSFSARRRKGNKPAFRRRLFEFPWQPMLTRSAAESLSCGLATEVVNPISRTLHRNHHRHFPSRGSCNRECLKHPLNIVARVHRAVEISVAFRREELRGLKFRFNSHLREEFGAHSGTTAAACFDKLVTLDQGNNGSERVI